MTHKTPKMFETVLLRGSRGRERAGGDEVTRPFPGQVIGSRRGRGKGNEKWKDGAGRAGSGDQKGSHFAPDLTDCLTRKRTFYTKN
jgi:hypothetical protein